MKLDKTALFPIAAALAAGSLHAQDCASPGADVAGWWDGDLVTPNVATDLTGQRSLTGDVASTPFLVGNALRFDGLASDVLSAGEPVLDSDATTPFTIECWVRLDPAATGINTIVAEVGVDAGTNEGQFALRRLPDGTLQFLRKTGVGEACEVATTPVAFPNGLPLHVVALWGQDNVNDNDLELWVNGTYYPRSGSSQFDVPVTHEFRVGETGDGTSPFQGEIDELIVYRRALADDEITASYLAGASGRCKSCAPIEAGALHHWTADAVCDGFLLDDEGGAALAPVGTQSFAPGMVGDSMNVQAGRTYTAGRPLVDTAGAFSVECWVRPDAGTGTVGILSEFGTDPQEGQWALRTFTDRSLQFLRFTGASNCSDNPCVETFGTPTGVLANFRWSHVAVTYDPVDGPEIWVDGVPRLTGASTSYVVPTEPCEFRVGSYGGNDAFDGRVDEVSVFRRELTALEVADRHRAGRWGRCATPNVLACHLGDEVDYRVRTRVDGLGDLDAPQKFVEPGDLLTVGLDSPGGSFHGAVPILAVSVIPSGTDVPSLPGAPGLHLTTDTTVLFNGLRPTPLGFTLLPAGGLTFGYSIPNGLQGFTARFQSTAYLPTRFISNAHDVEFR